MHVDIGGLVAIISIHGHTYFLTTIDYCITFTWMTLVKHKGGDKQHVIYFINLILTKHNHKFKTVKTDNGPEFKIPSF